MKVQLPAWVAALLPRWKDKELEARKAKTRKLKRVRRAKR